MTGLTLIPTQKRGILPLKNRTTQVDGVAYPTALHLCLDHKESNTRLIVSRMAAI